MTVEPPVIEGKVAPKNEVEERVERQEVLEQAVHMDMIAPKPVDETPASRDVERKPQDAVIEQAKANNKRIISEKQQASLERARAALSEKRRRLKADGHDGAQGGPAPDALINLQKMISEKFSSFEETLKDLKRTNAPEAPLQVNHIVQASRAVPVEAPADENSTLMITRHDAPKELPSAPVSVSAGAPLDEQKSFNRKFKDAFSVMNFQNDAVQQRMKASADSGATSTTNLVLW